MRLADVLLDLAHQVVIDVTLDGEHIETRFGSRQSRLLFGYLVLHRSRASSHHELIGAPVRWIGLFLGASSAERTDPNRSER